MPLVAAVPTNTANVQTVAKKFRVAVSDVTNPLSVYLPNPKRLLERSNWRFTLSVVKYLEPTISLAKKYNVHPYLQETIELLRVRVEGVFGKDAEKQSSLGAWFG